MIKIDRLRVHCLHLFVVMSVEELSIKTTQKLQNEGFLQNIRNFLNCVTSFSDVEHVDIVYVRVLFAGFRRSRKETQNNSVNRINSFNTQLWLVH